MVKTNEMWVEESNEIDERVINSILKEYPTFVETEKGVYNRIIVKKGLIVNTKEIGLLSCYELSEDIYTKEEAMKIFNDFIKSQELKNGTTN